MNREEAYIQLHKATSSMKEAEQYFTDDQDSVDTDIRSVLKGIGITAIEISISGSVLIHFKTDEAWCMEKDEVVALYKLGYEFDYVSSTPDGEITITLSRV